MNLQDFHNSLVYLINIFLHYALRVPERYLLKSNEPKKKSVLIETKLGPIEGIIVETINNKKISAFFGIPYAVPPVGKLRFCRSSPAKPWNGVLDGTKKSAECMQIQTLYPDVILPDGTEDCLYLNVYSQEKGLNLPVVVFIHGGGFLINSADYDMYGPQILLDRDIVLVVMNYRLGILGFLSLENDSAPGNLGLHDQYLALLWVKEHISQFGGDPDNITLMGHSAGAMSAMLHLTSPFSQGLFQRVLAMGGSPSNPYLHSSKQPLVYARALASKFGCPENADKDEILRVLQSQSAEDIVQQTCMFKDWDYPEPLPWLPIIDKFASQPFLPNNFKGALKLGNFAKVPIIMGCGLGEGTILSGPFYRCSCRWRLLSSQWNQWAPLVILNRERDLITNADIKSLEEIKEFYFGEDISSIPYNEETLTRLENLFSTGWFYEPWDSDAHLLALHGCSVYTFMLTLPTSFSFTSAWRMRPFHSIGVTTFRVGLKQILGINRFPDIVGHTGIMSLLFPSLVCATGCPDFSTEEDRIRQNLLDIVELFAKAETPIPRDLEGEDWKPVDEKKGQYLDIGKKISVTRDKEVDKEIAFWKRIKSKIPMSIQESSLLSRKPAKCYDDIAINR